MDERQKKEFRAAVSKVKLQYKTDRRNALPIRPITKLQIAFNLFWVAYNLYKFSTEDAKDGTNVFFNYIVMFFLLLMNLPLIGYRENKPASVIVFFVLLIFLVFFATIGYNESIKLILLMWLPNYLKSFFYNQKEMGNLGGTTVYYVLFWIGLLLLFLALNILAPELLPKNYNYGLLINALYSLATASLVYFSDKYRMMNADAELKIKKHSK